MCPSCENGYLQPTGRVFVCDRCGLALTQTMVETLRAHAPSLALLDLLAAHTDNPLSVPL